MDGRSEGMIMKHWERWSLGRIEEKPRCRVKAAARCIPMRQDSECRKCYEDDMDNPPKPPLDKGEESGEGGE